MKPQPKFCSTRTDIIRQRGLVLFMALIALVAMSLAAVALVRSVDTSTIIAGNLAFKQSATTSGDGGLESAIAWLAATSTANAAKNPMTDGTYPLNSDILTEGYYSTADPTLNLTADSTWGSGISKDAGVDATGNSIRYIIQRMCRNTGLVSTANCLFSSSASADGEHLAGELSLSSGGGSAMFRITARVTGPRNTVSYIQAFVY